MRADYQLGSIGDGCRVREASLRIGIDRRKEEARADSGTLRRRRCSNT